MKNYLSLLAFLGLCTISCSKSDSGGSAQKPTADSPVTVKATESSQPDTYSQFNRITTAMENMISAAQYASERMKIKTGIYVSLDGIQNPIEFEMRTTFGNFAYSCNRIVAASGAEDVLFGHEAQGYGGDEPTFKYIHPIRVAYYGVEVYCDKLPQTLIMFGGVYTEDAKQQLNEKKDSFIKDCDEVIVILKKYFSDLKNN